MNTRKLILFTLLAASLILPVSGQDNPAAYSLSLDEAVQVAYDNNISLKNARIDVLLAQKSKWEAITSGLPKADFSASWNDNLKLRTTLLPGDFFGQPGTMVPITFGTQYNADANITVSQLVFSGTWITYLQTSELLKVLSQQSLDRLLIETRQSVMQSYYMILISKRSMEIMQQNIENLKETAERTRKMQQVGVVEEVNVDQITVSVSMLENTYKSLERNLELSYNMLRFQLGLDPEVTIELSTSLDDILNQLNTESLLSSEFMIDSNIDYTMMRTQENLARYKVQSAYAECLPTISGFFQYGQSGMDDAFKIGDWFDYEMVGVQVNVPIFAGTGRATKIAKAKIELEKAYNTTDMVARQLNLSEKQLKYNLKNALDQYNNQKDNVALAEKVYQNTLKKYEQGMASTFDLTQANDSYLQAESSYLNSMMSLLNADLELNKLINNLETK
ncbi:MAG: TolC family protein [Bacteroidota bacterium]